MLLCGWKHEYEYLDLNGWIPGFAVWGHHGNKVWVEVKPEESFPEDTAVKMEDGLPTKYRERGDELLILGTEPSPMPYAPANRGHPRLGWLGRYAPSPDQGEWVWEDCLFGRWTDDAPFGFCDPSLPYHDRITGERSGGRLPGAEGDDLARLWEEAVIAVIVERRPPLDDYDRDGVVGVMEVASQEKETDVAPPQEGHLASLRVEPFPTRADLEPDQRHVVSPLVARLSAQYGVDLAAVGLECGGCGLRIIRFRVQRNLYCKACGPKRGMLFVKVRGPLSAVRGWEQAG